VDFEKVLTILTKEFSEAKIRYALIGGFAMGALGIVRSTMDLDFLIDVNDLPTVDVILKKHDYICVFKSENVSQYVSRINTMGEIDFLHAFRKPSLSMLDRAKDLPVLDRTLNIRVANPEDIIGLKLQALVNDASRKNREYADIEAIASHYRETLDWDLIKDYFSLFGQEVLFRVLKEKHGSAE
jgi:hypothetical protein